jgi:hypothetical protein
MRQTPPLSSRPNCDFCWFCGSALLVLPGRKGARACVYLHGVTIKRWPVKRRPVAKKGRPSCRKA